MRLSNFSIQRASGLRVDQTIDANADAARR